METLSVFTDGGCSGNPGPGGWGYVVEFKNERVSGSGAEKNTTNNRMELTAVIRALEKVKEILDGQRGIGISVFTDSQYVKNGISSWINTWERNGWKTASKEPVKNQSLWKELKLLSSSLPVSWNWVKGHAGNELNELCDTLVQNAISALRESSP